MRTIANVCLRAATLALAAVACANDNPIAPSAGVVERRISPASVNRSVVRWADDHFVWVTPHTHAARLAVLLPGTNGAPSNFRLIGRVVAEQGYHVIGLMYPDDRAVLDECVDDPSAACMESIRREIVEGIDVSPHVAVDTSNSIDGRLAALLAFLSQAYPDEGWSAFAPDGRIQWPLIVVAGHSQGGGHAAFIAKEREVARVVMFGAPADGYDAQVAPWMQLGATPADRYFGFKHARDPFTSIVPNWMALGLDDFGTPSDPTSGFPTFGGSHMLVTDALPSTGSYDDSHASVFLDFAAPRTAAGEPLFAPPGDICSATRDEDGKLMTLAALLLLVALSNRDSAAKLQPATFPTPPGDRTAHAERALQLPGAVLEYLDFGGPRSAPLVVLLPGYRDNAHVFDEFAPLIAAKYRVVALTPRGHGASATPDTGYTINTFSADARALLDTLGEHDAVLIGHSLAGSTITQLAVQSPDRVRALIYLDATMDLRESKRVGSANPLRAPPPTDSSAAGIRTWYARVVFGMWNDAFANEFAAVATGPNVAKRPQLIAGVLADATSIAKPFGSTRAPILAIIAKKSVETTFPWLPAARADPQRDAARRYVDSIVNPWWLASAAALRAARPDARIVIIPGHHYIYMSARERVVDEITAFLTGL